jgi:3-hydroxyacyl-[acyl-carrier-protein] dehydratase
MPRNSAISSSPKGVTGAGHEPAFRLPSTFATPLGMRSQPSITKVGVNTHIHMQTRVDAADAYCQFEMPDHRNVSIYPGGFFVESVRQAVSYAFRDSSWIAPDIHALRSLLVSASVRPGEEFELDVVVGCLTNDGRAEAMANYRRYDGTQSAQLNVTLQFRQSVSTSGKEIGRAEILSWVPYRRPMVLVDRVAFCEPGVSIRTIKAVSSNEPCYLELPDDCGPECCAYPTSLMLTSFGQSVALLMEATARASKASNEAASKVACEGRFRNVHVRAWAFPGDTLQHTIRLEKAIGDDFLMSGETWIDDRQVMAVASTVFCRRSPEFIVHRNRYNQKGEHHDQ